MFESRMEGGVEFVNGIPVLDAPNRAGQLFLGPDRGEVRGGYDPDSYVPDMHAEPKDMVLIPDNEVKDRITQQWRDGSGLIHQYLRSTIQPLDQNGQGFCWAYSTTAAVMLLRMRDGLPHVRLSAHALACKITGFRDQGAWSGLSAKHAAQIGVPPVDAWPEKSMNRKYDTAATWESAKRFTIVDQWYDLSRREWDQPLSGRQINTQLLLNNPVAADFMAMSHAMCIVGLGLHPDGDIMRCVINSWRGWGLRGLAWLRGPWANPQSAVAPFQVAATS